MNELITKDNIKIEDMIYEIRGKQVMLVSDIAKLYNVSTKVLNQTVKRNINRFPEDFCFQLTIKEANFLYSRSQIVTLNRSGNLRGSNIKYLPYVFTEHGIIMLSGLLKSDIAINMNKSIVIAFISMRKYLSSNMIEKRLSNVETKLIEHDNNFNVIMDKLDNTINNHIFFEGQIYDAYSLMKDIFNKSKESIIIIDNYVDKSLLDILSKTNKEITVITNKYKNGDYDKYKKQYNNVTLKINNTFHDRFIIIDKKILYHSGASFKDLGKKCFAITKVEDKNILKEIIKKLSF